MDIHPLDISKTINQFFDGLLFGFSVVTIISIIAYVFVRQVRIRSFIYSCIKVARVLAIIYLVFYSISFVYYYLSPEFELSAKRANGTYKWAYWFIVLRPIIFCLLLLLFWFKFWMSRLRYAVLLVALTSIVLLPSAIFFERIVILMAAYNSDYYDNGDNTILFIGTIFWFIFEKAILFAALVFASLSFNKKRNR